MTNSGEKDRYTMGKHQKGMPGKGGSPVEYDWYADLFFLEEVYRDVLILWLAAVLMRRRAEALRLLGAGIAGGLCRYLEAFIWNLWEDVLQAGSRYSLGYGKFGNCW